MKRTKKQTETQSYQNNFKRWNKDRKDIIYADRTGQPIYTYHPLDQNEEEFRQCYLSANHKKDDFYQVRKELPKDWWVSDRGYIVSFKGDIPKGYFGQLSNDGRMQVRLKENVLSYEAIKAFCFPERLNLRENETVRMIEEQGLRAFKRMPRKEFVELHHEKRIIPAKNNQEALKLLPENSDLNHINFLRSTVHDIMDGLGAYHKATDPEEKAKILAEKVADKGIKEPLFILPGNRPRTGTVASLINKDDQNIIIYTDPLLKKGDILDDTTVKLLQNLVNKTDRPQEVYKDINGTLYKLIAFRRQKKDLEKLKIAVEIEEK